ncbi:MAG: hypothetical protein KGD65_02105 [Candidatus Lokiarchaeota archaeon]|nr:hypothetical protein [Candidatus Lokiarchaeota archaeon]
MTNFCGECGKPVQPEWNVCPYCSYPLFRESKGFQQKVPKQESKLASYCFYYSCVSASYYNKTNVFLMKIIIRTIERLYQISPLKGVEYSK